MINQSSVIIKKIVQAISHGLADNSLNEAIFNKATEELETA